MDIFFEITFIFPLRRRVTTPSATRPERAVSNFGMRIWKENNSCLVSLPDPLHNNIFLVRYCATSYYTTYLYTLCRVLKQRALNAKANRPNKDDPLFCFFFYFIFHVVYTRTMRNFFNNRIMGFVFRQVYIMINCPTVHQTA